jgi:hypothetical protein
MDNSREKGGTRIDGLIERKQERENQPTSRRASGQGSEEARAPSRAVEQGQRGGVSEPACWPGESERGAGRRRGKEAGRCGKAKRWEESDMEHGGNERGVTCRAGGRPWVGMTQGGAGTWNMEK